MTLTLYDQRPRNGDYNVRNTVFRSDGTSVESTGGVCE